MKGKKHRQYVTYSSSRCTGATVVPEENNLQRKQKAKSNSKISTVFSLNTSEHVLSTKNEYQENLFTLSSGDFAATALTKQITV